MWDIAKAPFRMRSLFLNAIVTTSMLQGASVLVSSRAVFAQSESSSDQVETKQPARELHKPIRILEQSGGDPRGETDLTVCSQNLKLFGSYSVLKARDSKYSIKKHRVKVEDLVERFVSQNCDVIGVQEVLGKSEEESKAALKELAEELRFRTNRFYDFRVAPPADGKMTIGFLVAQDRAQITNTLAYSRV